MWLDRRRTTRLKVDAGRKVTAASRDDRDAEWVMFDGAGSPPGDGSHVVYCGTPETPLRSVILAMQANAAPVALFDSEERLVGSIGVRDVLQAICGRAATATKWTPDGADVAFFRLDKLTSLSTVSAQGNERLFGFISSCRNDNHPLLAGREGRWRCMQHPR